MKRQAGFTLIELVMVIVILGILAATALPRFFNLTNSARIAAVNGLTGSLRSATAIVHAAALVQNQTGPNESVTVDGGSVTTNYGYPDGTSTGIAAAITDYSGFNFAGGNPATFQQSGAPTPASCEASYVPATSATSGAQVLAPTTSGC